MNPSAINTLSLAAGILFWSGTAPLEAAIGTYYIGLDGLEKLTSGDFKGQDNPNFGRLTFLLSHGDHYHSKGIYRLSSTGQVELAPSNYLPEGQTSPIQLTLNTAPGLFENRLISAPYDDSSEGAYYSLLEIQSTRALSGLDAASPETTLFNSSAGRWSSLFDAGADLHLRLVGVTDGLSVGTADTASIAPGTDIHLGEGDESFSFTPIFHTASDAAPGVYVARFQLVDDAGKHQDSGVFEFRTQVVPEPTTGLLALTGCALLIGRRRRA